MSEFQSVALIVSIIGVAALLLGVGLRRTAAKPEIRDHVSRVVCPLYALGDRVESRISGRSGVVSMRVWDCGRITEYRMRDDDGQLWASEPEHLRREVRVVAGDDLLISSLRAEIDEYERTGRLPWA